MESLDKATGFIGFSFDAGRVTSVVIKSGWADAVAPEHFGTAALVAYHQQRAATRAFPGAGGVQAMPRIPAAARGELAERARALSRAAMDVFQRATADLAAGRPQEAPEPVEVTDDRRIVVLSVVNGQVADIVVRETDLKADSTRVEDALVEAFGRVEQAPDPTRALWAEFGELNRILDDYREA